MSLGNRKTRPLSKNAFVRGRKGVGKPNTPNTGILAENGNFLITEDSNYIIQE